MRSLTLLSLWLMVGCSRTASPCAEASTAAAAPTAESGSAVARTPARTRLYTDAHIRSLANFDIPCLKVVPRGELRPRGEVFKALGIEEARVGDFRNRGKNFVEFLEWQVSPSYDISCMTGADDPNNEGLQLTDPKRKVYGIRLLKRRK
jgi:hypothetical protein